MWNYNDLDRSALHTSSRRVRATGPVGNSLHFQFSRYVRAGA